MNDDIDNNDNFDNDDRRYYRADEQQYERSRHRPPVWRVNEAWIELVMVSRIINDRLGAWYQRRCKLRHMAAYIMRGTYNNNTINKSENNQWEYPWV